MTSINAIFLLRLPEKISIIRSLSQGIPFFNGPLAQLVEQLTLNQRVEGSTPSRLTIPTPRAVSSKRWLGGTLLSLLLPHSLSGHEEQLAVSGISERSREWRNWQTRQT